MNSTFSAGLPIPSRGRGSGPKESLGAIPRKPWADEPACANDRRMTVSAGQTFNKATDLTELYNLAKRCRSACPCFAECRADVVNARGRVRFEQTWLVVAGEIHPRVTSGHMATDEA